ncbi:MAG: TrmB family transcriptional regulator [Thermoplasmata archaeon]
MSGVKAEDDLLPENATEDARDQIVSALRQLGVSGYAADTFSALLGVSAGTAGDLVLKTGIPDSKIYYALDELVERGLVEVQAGRPKTYRVVSPKEAESSLQRMLERKHEREGAAVARVVSFLEPLRAATGSPAADLAYVVKGLSNVIARARVMVASARREVLLLSSEEEFVQKLTADLIMAGRRRVKVRMAVPDIALEEELVGVAEIRSIVCSCVIIVVDGRQMLTVNRTSDGSAYGITSMDDTLVRLGLDYWESPRCCLEP